MEEITIENLLEQIKDLEDNLKSIKFYLDKGATLRDFCNWQDEIQTNFEYFMKSVNDYADQEQLKELEYLRNQF